MRFAEGVQRLHAASHATEGVRLPNHLAAKACRRQPMMHAPEGYMLPTLMSVSPLTQPLKWSGLLRLLPGRRHKTLVPAPGGTRLCIPERFIDSSALEAALPKFAG